MSIFISEGRLVGTRPGRIGADGMGLMGMESAGSRGGCWKSGWVATLFGGVTKVTQDRECLVFDKQEAGWEGALTLAGFAGTLYGVYLISLLAEGLGVPSADLMVMGCGAGEAYVRTAFSETEGLVVDFFKRPVRLLMVDARRCLGVGGWGR